MTDSVRDKIRGAIFSSDALKPQTKTIVFFGQTIEIRQPNLRTILSISSGGDRQSAMVDMIIAYAYVPGSDEKVFEEADKDQLLEIPFGKDFSDLQKAITAMTDINFLQGDAEKNSAATPSTSST